MYRSLITGLCCTLACGAAGYGTALAQEGLALEGTLVVVNKAAATASVVDLASGELVATLPTGQGPHEIAITSDGRTAVVTDYGGNDRAGNTLTVIDVSRPAVEKTIELGRHRRPHGITFLPGDTLVAVTSEVSRSVIVVRLADGTITQTFPTGQNGSHMLAAVRDGSRIFTSNFEGSVSELHVRSGRRTNIVPVAPRLEAIGVTPDGSEVWVGSNERGTVSVVNPETEESREVLEGFGWPYRIFITPDARHAVIPDLRRNQLRFVDRTRKEQLGVLEIPGGPQGITLADDGRTLFQSLSREDRIAVIDLETRKVKGYIYAGAHPDGVAYSPLVLAR